MSEARAPIKTAVLVAARAGAQKRLARLLSLLRDSGVSVAVVNTAQDAAARILLHGDGPQCVFVDAVDAATGDTAAVADVLDKVHTLTDTISLAPPVVVAPDPLPALVVQAFRAGATDFIDLASDTVADVKGVLERLSSNYHDKLSRRTTVASLRGVIEDFLRDLVKTERRSIDLEHQLSIAERGSSVEPSKDLDTDRQPTVFIVEDDNEVADLLVDELESRGMVTFAFLNGEDAEREAQKMAKRGDAIDLALVDGRLPGIDGLETIRRLRATRPSLAAMLMTGYSDMETAAGAADLGVVGYVLKPFDDVGGLIVRIREQAEAAMVHGREQRYLSRIKERHEKVLSSYRKLASDLERLG
jgi:CheY-like chemotaxis protein